MSHIMEKTLASLPKLLSQSLHRGGNQKYSQKIQQPPPMDVQHFMRQIYKAHSRSQEVAIVKCQLESMREVFRNINRSQRSTRACFTKIIFCYQLGHDMSAMAVEAIKLAQMGEGYDKRLGYLVSCLLLHSRHELAILLTSTIMKDLISSNMMDNCIGLKAASELLHPELIPNILSEVINKFRHQQDIVKEKAIHCFRCLYLKAPELLENEIPKLNVFLTSRDPGILMAVTNLFKILTLHNPSRCVGLCSSFIHIMEQINARAFGSVYYYHMVPLPWLQINLLKILSDLAQVNIASRPRLEQIIKTMIEKTKVSEPISLALLVESIQTATRIAPSESLLQLCSRCIMKLMAPESSEDMRYQGLELLIAMSKVKLAYINQHQTAILDCLSSTDPAIQMRTTFLLHAMANAANVKVICDKLFDQFDKSNDNDLWKEILEMIINLAEKFPIDIEWFVMINFRVLSYDLGISAKDRIEISIVKHIEESFQSNCFLNTDIPNNILKQMLCEMEKEYYLNITFSVRLQILNVLVPRIPQLLPIETFFNIMTPIIFNTKTCDTTTEQAILHRMMNPAGHFVRNDNNVGQPFGSNQDGLELQLRVQCVETIIKLVMTQSLDKKVVSDWLQINYDKSFHLNDILKGVLGELEDTVLNSSTSSMSGKLLHNLSVSNLNCDLSLSFLDSFVVKNMLEGKKCYTPKYIIDGEKTKLDNVNSTVAVSSTKDNDKFEETNLLPSDIMSTSAKLKMAVVKKERWRDEDSDNTVISDEDEFDSNEQFSFIDADTSISMESDEKRQQLAEALFAGLDSHNINVTSYPNSASCTTAKASQNIWDDSDVEVEATSIQYSDERRSNFFSELHPFGITKTKRPLTSKPTLWYDGDDVSNPVIVDNCRLEGERFQESLFVEPPNDPPYAPTYFYHQPGDDSEQNQTSVYQEGISVEQETQQASIYSGYTDLQSPIVLSPNNAVSSLDNLTDSDPESAA